MKNIHVLPTDKPTWLHRSLLSGILRKSSACISDMKQAQGMNIYITSDDSEIKDGDNVILKSGRLTKAKIVDGILGFQTIDGIAFLPFKEGDKKIILTDDEDLIKDGVQKIDDEFLEWFLENSSCEIVDIETMMECEKCGKEHCDNLQCRGYKDVPYYKTIIPKEEGCSVCKGKKEIEVLVMGTDTEFVECYNCNQKLTKEEPKQTDWKNSTKNLMEAYGDNPKDFSYEEPKQEMLKEQIVGYRLKPHIDRLMVDSILKYAMPTWNDNDKSVYFIRGHVAGNLVAKLKELQVLDLWFTPIYESEEIESDWVKEHHLEYYYKKGIMSDKSKQETLEEADSKWTVNQAQEFALSKFKNKSVFKKGIVTWESILDTLKIGVLTGHKFGVKWQQEQNKNLYSEEQVELIAHEMVNWAIDNIGSKNPQSGKKFDEVLNKFKNK